MIQEMREIGRANDAPIIVIRLDLAKKEWVALAHKNNVEALSICFWSVRDGRRVATSELIDQIESEVAAQRAADTDRNTVLFDLQYKQPLGWDRWLDGIPRPVRAFFDETLYPQLKSLLDVTR